MHEWLHTLLGDYTRQLFTVGNTQLMFVIPAVLLSLPLRRKRRFPLRLLGFVGIWAALLALSVWLRTTWTTTATRLPVMMINTILTLPYFFLCVEEDIFTLLSTWCAGVAMEEIVATTYDFLMTAIGVDTAVSIAITGNLDLDLWLFYLIHLLLFLALYFIIGQTHMRTDDRQSLRQMTWLVMLSVTLITVMSTITYEHRAESAALYLVIRIYCMAFALLILLLRSGIVQQGQARAELAVMERVMSEERKQYEQNRESIRIINMRCHDLKHQLDRVASKLTDEEVLSLREAMTIYDSNIKTGNEVLDVVLYENQLTCRQEGIQLSCMAAAPLHAYSAYLRALLQRPAQRH